MSLMSIASYDWLEWFEPHKRGDLKSEITKFDKQSRDSPTAKASKIWIYITMLQRLVNGVWEDYCPEGEV